MRISQQARAGVMFSAVIVIFEFVNKVTIKHYYIRCLRLSF